MKCSELIQDLQDCLESHGDLNILVRDRCEWNHSIPDSTTIDILVGGGETFFIIEQN